MGTGLLSAVSRVAGSCFRTIQTITPTERTWKYTRSTLGAPPAPKAEVVSPERAIRFIRAEVQLVSCAEDHLCRLFPGGKSLPGEGASHYSSCTSALKGGFSYQLGSGRQGSRG